MTMTDPLTPAPEPEQETKMLCGRMFESKNGQPAICVKRKSHTGDCIGTSPEPEGAPKPETLEKAETCLRTFEAGIDEEESAVEARARLVVRVALALEEAVRETTRAMKDDCKVSHTVETQRLVAVQRQLDEANLDTEKWCASLYDEFNRAEKLRAALLASEAAVEEAKEQVDRWKVAHDEMVLRYKSMKAAVESLTKEVSRLEGRLIEQTEAWDIATRERDAARAEATKAEGCVCSGGKTVHRTDGPCYSSPTPPTSPPAIPTWHWSTDPDGPEPTSPLEKCGMPTDCGCGQADHSPPTSPLNGAEDASGTQPGIARQETGAQVRLLPAPPPTPTSPPTEEPRERWVCAHGRMFPDECQAPDCIAEDKRQAERIRNPRCSNCGDPHSMHDVNGCTVPPCRCGVTSRDLFPDRYPVPSPREPSRRKCCPVSGVAPMAPSTRITVVVRTASQPLAQRRRDEPPSR